MSKYITSSYPVLSTNGIKINTSYIQTKNCTVKSGRTISYIVMHYTGNSKDIAVNNARYFYNKSIEGSAHYFVDDDSIYQSVEVKNKAWHCGTSGTYYSNCRNDTSIGIEMCCTAGNYMVSEKTIKNAAYLCAELCKELDISPSEVDACVIKHYDVTHKSCPAQWVSDPREFTAFKETVKSLLNWKTITCFTDITGHYAEKHINKLIAYGIVRGYEDGTYQPDKAVSRAEFSTMIASALEKACGFNLNISVAFSDVAGHWAEKQIYKLVACGIVNGYEDGTFKPENRITRAQAAIIACNMLLYCGIGMKDSTGFRDTSGHYAERHIKTLQSYGVINGYEDGTFKPDTEITRGQAAMIVANCLTVLGK